MLNKGDPARWPEDDFSEADVLLGLIICSMAGTWMVFCGGGMLILGYSTSYMSGCMSFLSLPGGSGSRTCA